MIQRNFSESEAPIRGSILTGKQGICASPEQKVRSLRRVRPRTIRSASPHKTGLPQHKFPVVLIAAQKAISQRGDPRFRQNRPAARLSNRAGLGIE